MERPASVTVISALFFLAAGYLASIGIIEFIAPGTISTGLGEPVTFGRELTGPQAAISVGAGWALVAWGLYRLRNWARWCAMVLMVIGIAGSVPAVSAAARDLTWRFFLYGTEIMVRIVIAWLLAASPDVVDAFVRKRGDDGK
jgi:hypothetical protein